MTQGTVSADGEPPDGGDDGPRLEAPVSGAPDPRIAVEVAAAPAPDAATLSRWAAAALEQDARSVCMRVVDAAEGAALNARFRGGSGPTNVLSFPAGETGLLGDIAICAPVVAEEARAQRKTVAAHFAHMVVHGVFHLRGMDHGDDVRAARMEARESAVLHRLGFGDPYAATWPE